MRDGPGSDPIINRFFGLDKSAIMKMKNNRRIVSAVSSVFMHIFLFDDIFKYCLTCSAFLLK